MSRLAFMNSGEKNKQKVYAINCANILADQYGFAEDSIVENILLRCLPQNAPSEEQEEDLRADNAAIAIGSMVGYFKPDFVQALQCMDADTAKSLFEKNSLETICKFQDFFEDQFPKLPLFSKDQVNFNIEDFITFLSSNKNTYMKLGYINEFFESYFWLQSGLTDNCKPYNKKPSEIIEYYKRREQEKIDPIGSVKLWHKIENQEKIDRDFRTSISFGIKDRKKYFPLTMDEWFIEEEKLLRQKIFSAIQKTPLLIKTFNEAPSFSLVSAFLKLVEKTFSLPELSLLFEKSIRYFSWNAESKMAIDFKYESNFIGKIILFLTYYELDYSTKTMESLQKIFKPLISEDKRTCFFNLNVYEAINLTGSLESVAIIFRSLETFLPTLNKANKKASAAEMMLKKIAETNAGEILPEFEGVKIETSLVPTMNRPAGAGFSENFDTFFPADPSVSQLKLYPTQSDVVQFMWNKHAIDENTTVSKEDIFRIVYRVKYSDLFSKVKNGSDTATATYFKKLKNFRVDNYIFDQGEAWKLGFVRPSENNDNITSRYRLELEYYKKENTRKKRKYKSKEKRKRKK